MEKVLRHQGATKQAFIRDAVMTRVEQEEAKMRADDGKRREKSEAPRRPERAPGLGMGLGLRRERDEPPEDMGLPEPAAPPVVVNVGAPQGEDLPALLVEYIHKGPEHLRDERRRRAEEILATAPEADRDRLLGRFKEALAKKEGERGLLGRFSLERMREWFE